MGYRLSMDGVQYSPKILFIYSAVANIVRTVMAVFTAQ